MTSQRWKSSPQVDIDAYQLTDGRWLLFAYVKDESLVANEAGGTWWTRFNGEFKTGQIAGIARALKTEQRSEPLAPLVADGGSLPTEVWCREGWIKFRLETAEVLNPGLFLDQAPNRVRLIELVQEHYSKAKGQFGESDGLLNLFSYTGSFSIVALCAGAKAVTSVDVSARYLAWEKSNFEANFGGHDQLSQRLIKDDARDFLRRQVKKGTKYRWIVIDPPTFARGGGGKPFKVREELCALVEQAASCLSPGGAILASTNDARWPAREFYSEFGSVAQTLGFRCERGAVAPGFPPDHPLKSAWLLSAASG